MHESRGRQLPLIILSYGLSKFPIALMTGMNMQTMITDHSFGGLFGSCPLAIIAVAFANIFNNMERSFEELTVDLNAN